ncbi:MAG: tetratricopeptide repeat protein [Anaerolineaceae bacterium]
MDIPLISTKYLIPQPGDSSIERLRLIDKINNGLRLGKRLILVCAPAGYGKTTLIVDWVNRITNPLTGSIFPQFGDQSNIRTAWLTCETQDNDLAHFLAYLVASFGQGNTQIGGRLLETLHATKPPSPETLATLLLNELAVSNDFFILVLDDLHTISSQAINQFLNFLFEHHPTNLVLVLVTRADPSLPLSRYRARGQVIEIRQDELSFSSEEAAKFFTHILQIKLTETEKAILLKRTEGWPAGLQLAGLSLSEAKNIPTMIGTFSGSHEFIADFLTDEVLMQQPEIFQSFLLQSSILDRLSAPLCAAVTGISNSDEILEKLREKNLFLVSLDHEKKWYRFHTLFADLLKDRLHRKSIITEEELHLRASIWYQENGLLALAINHAFGANNQERAAILVEQAVEPAFINGQVTNLLGWLEALPGEIKNIHPRLWIYQGLSYIWCAKTPYTLKSELPELLPLFQACGLSGEAAMLQGLFAMTDGDPIQAARMSEYALLQLPTERVFFRCVAADTLGMTRILQCDTPAAIQAFNQVVDMAKQAGFVMFEIIAHSHLAGLNLQQGRLHTAAIGYQAALDLTIEKIGRGSPVTGNILLGLGELAREWGDLNKALCYFSESVEMFAQFSELGIPIAYLSIARVKASQNDYDSGEEYLIKARNFAQVSHTSHFINQLIDELQANFWIKCGKISSAEQWAQEKGLFRQSITELIRTAGPKVAGSEFNQNDYLTLARLYLAQNKPDAALEILNPLFTTSKTLGYERRLLYILVIKVLSLQRKKDVGFAEEVLKQALDLAEPEEYQQVFLDEGEQMLQLLHRVEARGNNSRFIKKLLASFSQKYSESEEIQNQSKLNGLIHPLSEREYQVLNLVCTGLTNKEICLQLHLSLSTVKGHTTKIYDKLGVNSRTQAIAEAIQRGLIRS